MDHHNASRSPEQQVRDDQAYGLDRCSIGLHDWQPTEVQGQRECPVCSTLSYCPGCSLNFPRAARIVRCAKHGGAA